MQLSVLIPTLNEAASVEQAIHAARALDSATLRLAEVIVADGHSDDDTAERAARAGAKVLSVEPGRGRQLRAAVEASTGEVLLMLHADAWLPPEAGRQIGAALEDPTVVCGAFRQRIDAAGWRFRLLEHGNALRARWLALPYGDQGVFVRREALDAVGGVPPLPLMEDVALMQRLRRLRWRGRRRRPALLSGPIRVSARRWRRHGVARQTLRNWALLAAFTAGVPAERLAPWYAPHA